MNIGIDDIFDMLSWNSDTETQLKGIELAKEVKCYSVFIQPTGLEHSIDIWDNCANIIVDLPDEILQYYLFGLLEWVEDINWPGAETVLKRLIKMEDVSLLSITLARCVKEALACDLQGWLSNLSELITNDNLKKCLSKDIYDALYRRYNNNHHINL